MRDFAFSWHEGKSRTSLASLQQTSGAARQRWLSSPKQLPTPWAPICQERSTVEHQALEESWGGLTLKGQQIPPDYPNVESYSSWRKTTFSPVKTTKIFGHLLSFLSLPPNHSNMQRPPLPSLRDRYKPEKNGRFEWQSQNRFRLTRKILKK